MLGVASRPGRISSELTPARSGPVSRRRPEGVDVEGVAPKNPLQGVAVETEVGHRRGVAGDAGDPRPVGGEDELLAQPPERSEERRVGKEWRSAGPAVM